MCHGAGALERMWSATRLDGLFGETAVVQNERELLFSQLVEWIGRVVTRVDRSVLKSYESWKDEQNVSDQAVYDKLQGIETCVSQALVRDSFREARAVLEQLKVLDKSWMRGRQTKILDGNHWQATQHRIEELRTIWDAPLPGTALVVWDQMTQLVSDVFLTEDGHAQERSLIAEVLETVTKDDLWIMDRNFCTLKFLFGIWAKNARFVARQHGQWKGEFLGKPRLKGTTERGEKVYEQQLQFTFQGHTRNVRRITVKLSQPMRDGSTELHILMNLPPREAPAMQVADLYQKRWTIETVFLQLKTALQCEINTLGYPKAALFTFCVALLLQNTLSMLLGSRCARGRGRGVRFRRRAGRRTSQHPRRNAGGDQSRTLAHLLQNVPDPVREHPAVPRQNHRPGPLPKVRPRPEAARPETHRLPQRRPRLDP